MIQQHSHAAGTIHALEKCVITLIPLGILGIMVRALPRKGWLLCRLSDHAFRWFINDHGSNDHVEIGKLGTLGLGRHYPPLPKYFRGPEFVIKRILVPALYVLAAHENTVTAVQVVTIGGAFMLLGYEVFYFNIYQVAGAYPARL